MRKETRRVAGLPLLLYLIVLELLFLVLYCGVVPAGLLGGLLLLPVFDKSLNELGKSVLFVWIYFRGSTACVFGSTIIGVSDLLPEDSTEISSRSIGGEGPLILYMAVSTTGSLFQIDRRLLFHASLHILSITLVGAAVGAAVMVLLGFLWGFSVTEGLLYIAVSMTSDGMIAGVVPLFAIYTEASDIPASETSTRIAPATVLGSIVPILFGTPTVRFLARFSKLSGDG